MNKVNKYNMILEDLIKEFDNEKFKDLDKELSKIIDDGNYIELFYLTGLERELEVKFDKLFYAKNKKKNYSKNCTNVIEKFAILCENSNKEFYLTRTFKSYIQMRVMNDYPDDIGIDFFYYIKKYLNYTNKEYLMINSRTAYFIINATRIKRYKNYRKIKNILKEFKEEYDITKYNNIINNKISLNTFEFIDFIREVNKIKIDTGLIPFEICEYLIFEMLNPDSIISKGYEFWADLRECVFCDYISHIQINCYKVYDYFNYSKKMKNYRGIHNYKNKKICVDEDVIYNFSNIDVRAIITSMHELVHFKQYILIHKNDFRGANYEILKEDILSDKIKSFKEKNSWYLSKEIEARKESIENAINYLESLEKNISVLKIRYEPSNVKPRLISLLEYKHIVLEDCEKSLFEKEYNNTKLNFNKKLNSILKKDGPLISNIIYDNPILKYEYNEDGTRKNINDIILLLEKSIISRELSRENAKGILKYSILNNFNIKNFETVVKKIIKYKYDEEKTRKLFIEVLESIIIEKQSRAKLINDLDKRGEFESLLNKQLDYIKNTIK